MFGDNSNMSLKITEEVIARQPPEAQAIIRLLLAENARLESRIEELQRQVKGKTPQNSSLPPSTQHPHAKPISAKPKSDRKRGGQPGHAKHQRPLLPTEDCDASIPLKPEACRRCGGTLAGVDPEPLRHQVWELPEINPHVTEYQLHRLPCACCGETTCAELPAGVPRGQGGPRLVAFVALLMAYFRQSKRRAAMFLETILGQPCSPAWTVKLQQQATEAARPAYDELVRALPEQARLSGDETPTKEGQQKAWLWTVLARTFTVFTLRTTHAASVLVELLGAEFSGIMTCDRAKIYWCLGRLQWCWAHLKRDFQALADSEDRQVRRLGLALMRPTRKLFELWARYRDGTLTRRGLKRLMQPIRDEVEELLVRGILSGNPALVGMCHELFDHSEWLWTFVDHEGVEPTNNASERALRHAVIWRKLSFGTQSVHGSRFVETMLTVIETCRQQNRNVFAFLTAATEAHFAHRPAPSLLPSI